MPHEWIAEGKTIKHQWRWCNKSSTGNQNWAHWSYLSMRRSKVAELAQE